MIRQSATKIWCVAKITAPISSEMVPPNSTRLVSERISSYQLLKRSGFDNNPKPTAIK